MNKFQNPDANGVIFVHHLTTFSLLLVAGLVLGHNVVNIPQLKPPFFAEGHSLSEICCLSQLMDRLELESSLCHPQHSGAAVVFSMNIFRSENVKLLLQPIDRHCCHSCGHDPVKWGRSVSLLSMEQNI